MCLGEEFDTCILKLHTLHVSKEGCNHTEGQIFFSNFAFSMLFIVKGIRETTLSAHFTTLGVVEKAPIP